MNTTPLPDDALDSLLSDFFKGQMKKPWPAAPAAANAASEPSVLAAARARQPGAEPNPVAARDPGGRARYTLAASVAILLGTCWTLSNGFQADRPAGPNGRPGIDLNRGSASGTNGFHGEVKKAADPRVEDNGFAPPKIDLP